MKRQFVIFAVCIITAAAVGSGCKKKGSAMEDFSGALNMQYESYKIIKENKDDPAQAGKLFTEYYKKNRNAVYDAFSRYYKKYGDGSDLAKEETVFLDGEMQKVNDLLSDKDIQKVMDDPAFVENAREGTRILTGIRDGSK